MNETGKISYIEFPARNIDATKAFYSSAFGWSFVDYGPDYVSFQNAGMDGGFYKSDKTANTATGSALVVLYSDELEHTFEMVLESGGEIVEQIFKFPGGRRFHFADPNGNELAVWSEGLFHGFALR